MAWTARLVPYQYAVVQDRPGQGAAFLAAFRETGVNLLACHAFPAGRGRTQVDLVAKDARALGRAARRTKLPLSKSKTAFLVQGDDRPGVLSRVMEQLGAAGVNVTAVTGIAAGAGRFGAILWVKPRDVRRAAKALGA
jgi:hypothetical protein